MQPTKKKQLFLSFFLSIFFFNCNSDSVIEETTISQFSKGSGFLLYQYSVSNYSKTMRIYYHIPENATSSTPILMVFHGVNRNAKEYRDAFISASNSKNFIVITPEFSEQNFPTGDAYALGNVYVDGDNPTSNSLNPESQWTFSIIEPLFDFIKNELKNTHNSYSIFGHSAGAQFAHRFLMFKPNNRANQTVISAAGWYTFPDKTIPFPYGLKNSILGNTSPFNFFSKKIVVQVGELDNNPNDANLRHNDFADAQGLHRLERAKNYFDFCKEAAQRSNTNFNWTFHINKNANHNYVIAAQNAANLLFN